MDIFSERTGRVVLIPDVAFPLTVRMDGWAGGAMMKAVITQLGLQSQGNYQFLHTLKNFIYVYVFGERIADLMVGGLSFPERCPGGGGPTGFELVYQYYLEKRISTLGAPITVAIGTSLSFSAWLVAHSGNLIDPQNGMCQFQLAFKFFPPSD
jgi:hypothetical protein